MAEQDKEPLKGKNAVVTGGHRGLGSAISLALAKAGANIAIIDRKGPYTPEGLRTKSQLMDGGIKVWSFIVDLADSEDTEKQAKDILETLGSVDILVNNAGVALMNNLKTTTVTDWNHVLSVNLTAPFILAKIFGPSMVSRRYGKIINIGSVAGQKALEEHGAYCASKAALEGLTRVMAAEWSKYNVQCNTVAPTIVMTQMAKEVWGEKEKREQMLSKIPAKKFATAEDVAEMVVFLASPAAGMVCGQTIAVDGGFTAM